VAAIAYVNGTISAIEDARVSVEDRGLQFGHSVYEVVYATNGAYFRLPQHLARLERSRRAADIPSPAAAEELTAVAIRLLELSAEREGALYIQLTAGTAPRQHVRSSPIAPTLIMTFRPLAGREHHADGGGVRLVTHPDLRWARRDIKATTLLANVLAREEAARRGADEALLYEPDGVITECSAANFFAVVDGRVRTHPPDGKILEGVTRAAVLELCGTLGLACEEVPMRVDDLPRATEAFITGTVLGIAPVAQIDADWHRAAGPLTGRLQDAYRELVRRETTAARSAGWLGRAAGT
jgi:D-alanine transaminase